jgi:hypothetical protein
MLKKSFISVIVVMTLFVSGIITSELPVYADTNSKVGNKVELSIAEIVNNINGTKTFEKSYALCVRAKEDTIITFQQYWFKSDEEKSIVSKKRQSETTQDIDGTWVLRDKMEQWEIGASGIYAKSITWKLGKNKIELKVKDKGGNTETLTMIVELVDKKQLNDAINSYILKNIGEDL